MNKELVKAVIRQLGDKSYLQDVADNGADSGYPGFTYYVDTVKFWRDNRKLITELLEETASDFGYGVINMVLDFNCLRGCHTDDEVGRALYGNYKSDYDVIYNALAWFALEETARYFQL